MNVLSLFDGMAGARLALEQLDITPTNYYASEIDKAAIKVANQNFPDIKQVGDVTSLKVEDFPQIDLLIGGSPCTNLASCGDREGLKGQESKLFYEFVRILKEFKPKYFLLENVASMSKENKDIISNILGVQPVLINSSSLTAQNRNRLYWFNWKSENIVSNDISFYDILDSKEKALTYRHSEKAIKYMNKQVKGGRTHWDFGYHAVSTLFKTPCLVANLYKGVPYNVVIDKRFPTPLIRSYTPLECERLQGVKDNYTSCVSKTQRYKMLGNGFTIPVIAHLLKTIFGETNNVRTT